METLTFTVNNVIESISTFFFTNKKYFEVA